MNLSNLIFTWLLGTGMVTPINDTNDGRQLYTLYVFDRQNVRIIEYNKAYEEEIIEWIETGTFEYESESEPSVTMGNQIMEEEYSDD